MAQSIDVTLRTPDGQVWIGQAMATVNPPPLSGTMLSPTTYTSGVATAFTLTGTGFQPGMTIQFGTVMASNVQVQSSTQATGVVTV